MKRFKHISMLLAFAAVLSLVGCTKDRTSDVGGVSGGDEDGKFFYVSAAIALPTSGTRSGTDDYDPSDNPNDNGNTNSDINNKEDDNGNKYDDYEYGYDYENDVRSMLIVVANKNEEYVTHTFVRGIEQIPTGKANFDFYANGEIKHTDMEKAYATGGVLSGDDKEVHIYVYCNYTANLRNKFEDYKDRIADETTGAQVDRTEWIDWYGEVEEAPSPAGQQPTISNTIWASRSFLMTNARPFTTTFPEKITDWEKYADESNPFKMQMSQTTAGEPDEDGDETPIYVERAAARLDFKDGSDEETDPNTYPLLIDLGDEETDADDTDGTTTTTSKGEYNLFSIELTRMALVNMSKNFYYLRRVSDDGFAKAESTQSGTSGTTTTGNNWTLSGLEKIKNYVVDTDALVKAEKGTDGDTKIEPSNAYKYFNFTLFNTTPIDGANDVYGYNKAAWYVDNIDDVLKGKKDTWTGSANNKYSIWRYVTENTIPENLAGGTGDDEYHRYDFQKTKQSVGIVFKGSIIAGKDINERYIEYSEEVAAEGDQPSATVEGAGTEDPDTTEPEMGNPERHYVSLDVRYALAAAKEHKPYKAPEDVSSYTPVITEPIRKADAEQTDAAKAAEVIEENIKKIADYNYPALYSFDNKLYAGVDDIVKGAIRKGQGSRLEFALNEIFANWHLNSEGKKYEYVAPTSASTKAAEETTPTVLTVQAYYDDIINGDIEIDIDRKINNKEGDANFIKLAPAEGITVYEISNENDGENWGYYCYYFYWNRHNDNNLSGRMGRMEFATVRNNVYKLAVTEIGRLGHPGDPSKDPDPVKPEDPDEDPTDYIQVKVEVLPWVVRVNNIKF